MSSESVAGSFLVATPMIGGGPFWQSVILILEHDESGAVGVIINERTTSAVADHLPDLAALASNPSTVFVGGPVQPETAIVLVQSPEGRFIRPTPLETIGVVDPDDLPHTVVELRVYAGYAGWDPHQLNDEIDEGSWWVLPVDRAEVFGTDPDTLWSRLVASAPGTIPFHRTYPQDVSLN